MIDITMHSWLLLYFYKSYLSLSQFLFLSHSLFLSPFAPEAFGPILNEVYPFTWSLGAHWLTVRRGKTILMTHWAFNVCKQHGSGWAKWDGVMVREAECTRLCAKGRWHRCHIFGHVGSQWFQSSNPEFIITDLGKNHNKTESECIRTSGKIG